MVSKTVNSVAKPVKEFTDKAIKPVKKVADKVNNQVKHVVDKAKKEVKDKVINPAKHAVDKAKKEVKDKVINPAKHVVDKANKEIKDKVNKAEKEITNNVIKNVVKPSINTLHKIEPLVKPTINKINKFLNSHPKIKKISDPLIKEIKSIIKDPRKQIEEILKDPKNAPKIVGKALNSIIDKIKAFHPLEKIKDEIKHLEKDLENFMEKNKIPVKEIKKLFINESHKVQQTIKQLSQKARNGIYWLKKKGYWEPIKFIAETAGQYAAESVCSAFLSPLVCGLAMDIVFTFVVDKYLDSL